MVYIDETCFTRKTMVDTEYNLPKQNTTIDTARLQEPTLALLNAISKEKGQEHYMVFPKSVNMAKFKKWLDAMRAANGDDKICLLMDNLSVHRSDKAKNYMKELGFRYIFCPAYSPQYNPIELVFAKIKQRFKALRAMKLVGLLQDDHEALVHKAVKSVRKKDIVNCIDHVLRFLK